jgi:hypothetical protein
MAKKYFDNMPEVDRDALAASLNLSPTAYKGLATTSTVPTVQAGVPQWWLASGAGTYTNFDGLEITGNFAVLSYNGTSWSKYEQTITSPSVVQTKGQSTTTIMSQKASSDYLNSLTDEVFKYSEKVTEASTITGKYIHQSGSLSSNASYNILVYPVAEGDRIRISGTLNGNFIAVYAFFSNQECTNLVSVGTINSGTTTHDLKVNVPNGATFVGVTKYTSYPVSLFTTTSRLTSAETKISSNYDALTKFNVLNNPISTISGKYIHSANGLQTDANYNVYVYDLSSIAQIRIKGAEYINQYYVIYGLFQNDICTGSYDVGTYYTSSA